MMSSRTTVLAETSAEEAGRILGRIVGENLSGVSFASGDYVQLQFNGLATLNVYSLVAVHGAGREATKGDDPFANLLVAQVGRVVVAVELDPHRIAVSLDDGAEILVPLSGADCWETAEYFGPEGRALVFNGDGTMLSGVEQ